MSFLAHSFQHKVLYRNIVSPEHKITPEKKIRKIQGLDELTVGIVFVVAVEIAGGGLDHDSWPVRRA